MNIDENAGKSRGRNAKAFHPGAVEVVYFIRAERLGLIKIGKARDPDKRLSQLACGSPDNLSIIGVVRDSDAVGLEARIHQEFAADRERGEWFRPSDALMAFIDAHAKGPEADAADCERIDTLFAEAKQALRANKLSKVPVTAASSARVAFEPEPRVLVSVSHDGEILYVDPELGEREDFGARIIRADTEDRRLANMVRKARRAAIKQALDEARP